ncbi:MAG TPA: L-2-hydroxyglutarate oxidase [Rhodothermia bacterium]|nr:L-2-hydroxyglutarate oxidase [Rhodothermia bacterium]
MRSDVVIVGGGIVGLATAWHLTRRRPRIEVTLIEKEGELAFHQTGRNSGVLHSGIYYKPGSLKAENCRIGKRAMVEFCRSENIPFELCGKVIVATGERDLPALERIFERGKANEVACEVIGPERLRELEPHASGIRAIHVPEAGIVDYREVAQRLGVRIEEQGGVVKLNTALISSRPRHSSHVLVTSEGEIEAGFVINCAGLQSDRVARLLGQRPEARIVPFRGEYFELKPEVGHLCRNLIYPVPDPAFPFLGVHFTRVISGGVECGPNAVLAFAREGYRKTDVRFGDLIDSLLYPGFLRLAGRYWRTGFGEMWRSINKKAFVRALQRLVPEIRGEHLIPAPAGVRAQALSRDGSLVDDFLFIEGERVLSVCNAPSPAATSALNIGSLIVDRIERHLG